MWIRVSLSALADVQLGINSDLYYNFSMLYVYAVVYR
jgi:hypothetical protein